MKVYYTDTYVFPLPDGHSFPAEKYSLLRKRLMESDCAGDLELSVPEEATDADLRRVHERGYLQRVLSGELSSPEVRRIGLPWSPQLVERARRASGATIAACRTALQEGVAVQLAGGTHHAFSDRGEGYCLFNDSAVAARAMQAKEAVRTVIVIDCDVHQGNGTAAIHAADPSVFTLSLHGRRNFPHDKEHSDLDIALEDQTGDDEYLAALEQGLQQAHSRFTANMAIYLAGADPFRDDRLGRLALTKAGLARRDRMVFDHCRALGLPVAVTMSGGYARDIRDTVDIQYETVRAALELWKVLAAQIGPRGSWIDNCRTKET